MSDTRHVDVNARLMVLYILWVAFAGSVVVYGVVAFLFNRPGTTGDEALHDTLRLAFAAVSLAIAPASFWWRRSVVGRHGGSRPAVSGQPGSESASREDQEAALGGLMTNCLIVWALCESVALFGLVLTVLTHNFGDFVPFAFGSLALLVWHRPGAWSPDRILGRRDRPA